MPSFPLCCSGSHYLHSAFDRAQLVGVARRSMGRIRSIVDRSQLPAPAGTRARRKEPGGRHFAARASVPHCVSSGCILLTLSSIMSSSSQTHTHKGFLSLCLRLCVFLVDDDHTAPRPPRANQMTSSSIASHANDCSLSLAFICRAMQSNSRNASLSLSLLGASVFFIVIPRY